MVKLAIFLQMCNMIFNFVKTYLISKNPLTMNVDFITAIKMFFANYFNFKGRSTRAEYWWVYLFTLIVAIVLSFFGKYGSTLSGIFSLAILIPNLALTVRRLHDTGRSGYWLLGYYILELGICTWFFVAIFNALGFANLEGLASGRLTSSQIAALGAAAGQMCLPLLVALALGIGWIVLMCQKSAPDNKYGADPYGE